MKLFPEFNKDEFVKGGEIQKKTGLTPDDINEVIKALEKSLPIGKNTSKILLDTLIEIRSSLNYSK